MSLHFSLALPARLNDIKEQNSDDLDKEEGRQRHLAMPPRPVGT